MARDDGSVRPREELILYRLDELARQLDTSDHKLDAVQRDVTALSLKVEHRLTKIETDSVRKGLLLSALTSAVIAGVAAFFRGRV